jgi:hypothetical protein
MSCLKPEFWLKAELSFKAEGFENMLEALFSN